MKEMLFRLVYQCQMCRAHFIDKGSALLKESEVARLLDTLNENEHLLYQIHNCRPDAQGRRQFGVGTIMGARMEE